MARMANMLAIALLLLTLLTPVGLLAAQADDSRLQVISIDPSGHPEIDILVSVRDTYGRGVHNLKPADFTVEEQGRVIPGELLRVTPTNELPAPLTLVIVLDMSELLGRPALAAVQADARALIEQAMADQSAEVALVVPRSDSAGQQLLAQPFTANPTAATEALAKITPRAGKTDLYNAVVAGTNAAADRAGERGGPAYVVVLSDGQDRTSIVGSGSAGANEAARVAEDRHVQIFTFGYGAAVQRGGALLAQLADRAGGAYQPDPDQAALGTLAKRLRESASGGGYRLRYTSQLPADGSEHMVAVRANAGGAPLAAEARYVLPQAWDSATPARLDLRLDARAYPDVTLWTRPVNHLRGTVPGLGADDFRVELDGQPVNTQLNVATEPLDPHDPAASQSVALAIDLQGEDAQVRRDLAAALLQAPTEVPSRVALFAPGVPADDATFTHDHNALINVLNQAPIGAPADGAMGNLLLVAIEAAARDGDAQQRPAYVVLLTGQPLAPDLHARALTLARARGVTIETITSGPADQPAGAGMERLAQSTQGEYLAAPDGVTLASLAGRIAQNQAVRYRITFQAPLLADGKERTLTLGVGDQRASAPIIPAVAGEPTVQAPLPIGWQILAGVLTALVLAGCALLPRLINDRRLRCPTCGKVRRASWGDTCLFCEYIAIEGPASAGETPLDGLAAQGAALAFEPALGAPLDAFAAQGAALASEPLRERAFGAPEEQAGEPQIIDVVPVPTPAFVQPAGQATAAEWELVENNPIPAATGNGAAEQRLPERPAPTPLEPADRARVQSHTDFWGALPDEPPIEPADEQAAPERPRSEPPPLLVFEQAPAASTNGSRDSEQPPEVRERAHTDFWGALPGAPDTGDPVPATEQAAGSPDAQNDNDRPVTHTDFWGPLVADPAPGDAGDTSTGATPERPEPQDPPANGHTQEAVPHVEKPATHTDFWGPLPDRRTGEESGSHTDFWGPAELVTSDDEEKRG